MKKITIFLNAVLVGITIFPLFVNADIIPDNSHPLELCAKIINLNEFPEISLIGRIIGPMAGSDNTFLIENDECLSRGYKFNSLQILVTTKNHLNSIGIKNFNPFIKVLDKNVVKKGDCYINTKIDHSPCSDSIDYWYKEELSDENVSIISNDFKDYGGYVNKDNPLVKQEVEYSILKSSDNKISLEKTKIISKYNNGDPDKIETFLDSSSTKKNEVKKDISSHIISDKIINDNDVSPVQLDKKSFWHKLACFFGIIRNC